MCHLSERVVSVGIQEYHVTRHDHLRRELVCHDFTKIIVLTVVILRGIAGTGTMAQGVVPKLMKNGETLSDKGIEWIDVDNGLPVILKIKIST